MQQEKLTRPLKSFVQKAGEATEKQMIYVDEKID
jgi:hypothetical protein